MTSNVKICKFNLFDIVNQLNSILRVNDVICAKNIPLYTEIHV